MTPRLQNRISSLLSGWYTGQWGTDIVIHNDTLFVKLASVADEIVYNIREELEIDLVTSTPTDPKFKDWESALNV